MAQQSKSESQGKGLRALFQRLGRREPPGTRDSLTSLLALLQEMPLPAGIWLLQAPIEEDLWVTMMTSAEDEPAATSGKLDWVMSAAQLVLVGDSEDGRRLWVDRETDDQGKRRVYASPFDDCKPTLCFPEVDELFAWVAGHLDDFDGDLPTLPPDTWSQDPRSAEGVMSLLLALHPTRLFEAYRSGTWVAEVPEVPAYQSGGPAQGRLALLDSLAGCARHKRLTALPGKLKPADLTPVHRVLRERLGDLVAAMDADEVPAFIKRLADDERPDVQEAAAAWVRGFEAARRPTEKTAEAQATDQMLSRIRLGLQELRGRELLDIEEEALPQLSEELLEVAMKTMPFAQAMGSAGPRHLVDAIIEAMVDSPLLEDVYGEDAELYSVFAQSLGFGAR